MSANPFRPAEQVVPKVKCLIYGQSGVGKTYLALTAPGKVAVIDTEGGTAFYANRTGLSDFDVLPTKTFNDVTRAVAYLRENAGEYSTLVIDPVTVLYETLQDAAQMRRANRNNNPDADLEMLDWQQIKRAYKQLMTDLINLPLHVIVTARERDETVKQGREFVKIGVRPDAEKSTPYYFDTIVRLTAKGTSRSAVVEKDRTGTIPAEVASPSFDKLFNKAIKANAGATAERSMQSDTDAAETDAETTFSDDQRTSLPRTPDGGLIGKVATKGTQDFELRLAPEGASLPFRVKDGNYSLIVVAHGALADSLAVIRDRVLGERVTVWGTFSDESIPPKDGKPAVQFQVLHLTRIQTPDGMLPPLSVAPDPSGEPVEAETAPLFSDEEQAKIDAAVEQAGAA